MNISRKQILITLISLIPLIGAVYGIYIQKFYLPLSITVDAQVQHPDTFQLFYDTGNGFNEKESVLVSVLASNEFQPIIFTIPTSSETIRGLRIDPGSANTSIAIKEILLTTSQSSFIWKPNDLLNEFSFYFDISSKKIISFVGIIMLTLSAIRF